MDAKITKCLGCPVKSCNADCRNYREAADRIWDMASEYERAGLIDLSEELKQICQQIHDLARLKQAQKIQEI